MHRALALYSGGLDSLLSILILRELGVEVVAIKFLNGFVSSLSERDFEYARKFSFELKQIDIREKFIDILKSPKHGFGRNLNPCIDCKILMLREIKEMMPLYEAKFVITGDVVSQRLMSQKRETLIYIERQAGLEGKIIRPLSAKLLPITEAEREGLINREKLYEIWGRTRKPQIELANRFGLSILPQPSGGCLLTDPSFCRKVKDLIEHDSLNSESVEFLRIGRHFRISKNCKAIVGRNERESENLLRIREGIKIHPFDFKGPVVLLLGECSERDIETGTQICSAYSKGGDSQIVIRDKNSERTVSVKSVSREEIEKYRI